MTHPSRDTRRRTRWFDGQSTCPGKPGVYERKATFGPRYSYWNGTGTYWGLLSWSPGLARCNRKVQSAFPALPWRGLAKDPAA